MNKIISCVVSKIKGEYLLGLRKGKLFKGVSPISKKIKILGIFSFTILISAIYCNCKYPFPHFWYFIITFGCIGLGASFSILFFTKTINEIIGLTVKEPPCEKARILVQKCQILKTNRIVPCLVVVIFGVGGCIMFSELQITPTFLCCISIFAFVVYISILGYLKYIYLCMFIYKIAFSTKRYKHLPKMQSAKIPPSINWFKKLENLFLIYQAAFFFLGLLYIIAFWKFCFSPEFGVMIDSIIFFFLWFIIFIAIVLTFPVVVLLEKNWIKKIEENMIEFYFLESKKDMLFFEEKYKFSEIFADAIRRNIIENIMEKKENNVKNIIFKSYSSAMTIINFVVSIITIFQFCTIDFLSIIK